MDQRTAGVSEAAALAKVPSPAEDLPVPVAADDLLACVVRHDGQGDLLQGGGRHPASAVGVGEGSGAVQQSPAGESDVVAADIEVGRGKAERSVDVDVNLSLHPQQSNVHLAGLALVVPVYLDPVHGVLHGQVGLPAGAVCVLPQHHPQTAGLDGLQSNNVTGSPD